MPDYNSSYTGAQVDAAVAKANSAVQDIGTSTAALTAKTTPVDADSLPISDSAASGAGKKLTWANLKTALGSVFQAASANLTAWAALATNAKQDALVSGTNIKTINGSSVLGSGDLTVSGGASPAGTGTELQYRSSGSAMGAVSGSSVSGADVAFGGYVTASSGVKLGSSAALTYGSGRVRATDANSVTWVPIGAEMFAPANQTYGIMDKIAGPAGVAVRNSSAYYHMHAAGLALFGTANTVLDLGVDRNAAGVVEINNGTAGSFRDIKLRNLTATGNLQLKTVATSSTAFTDADKAVEFGATSDGTYSALISGQYGVLYHVGATPTYPGGGMRSSGFYATCGVNTVTGANSSAVRIGTLQGVSTGFGIGLIAGGAVAWSSSTSEAYGSQDVGFSRSAAGVLEINSGTAGTYRDLKLRNLIATGTTAHGQFTNATEPSWANGSSYFNTDLDKLRIGGASGWETVTSV